MARVMAIAAHPDDEIFAGGTMARCAAEGNDMIIVVTTRGEGGEVGDPPLCSKERLGEIREREMRCAAGTLGASDVIFLGFIDPSIEIDEPPLAIRASMSEFSAAIEECLERTRPDVVITHGSNGEYGHPQHVYTHLAVRAAIGRTNRRPSELLTWSANTGNAAGDRLVNVDDLADIVVDITPWFEAKAAALECHRTQHAMIRRNSGKQDIRDAIHRIEAFKRWKI